MDEGGGVREEGLGSWGEGVEVREVGCTKCTKTATFVHNALSVTVLHFHPFKHLQ